MNRSKSFYIDNWHIDTEVNRLSFRNQEIKLESKVMDVLVYLADHAGEIVSREALERDVWAGKVVGYDSLTSTINKIRKAFDDDSRAPRYIETVSKKGYRLIAKVSEVAPDGDAVTVVGDNVVVKDTVKGSRKFPTNIVAGLFVILTVLLYVIYLQVSDNAKRDDIEIKASSGPSIVVLPFSDLGENASQEIFGSGFTEDVTTALSKLSGLFVIARSTAAVYKDEPLDARQVASVLGVQYVLEGSVRRSGNELRVNASLIDGGTGFRLWSESYDREMKDLFDVQDDITLKIVSALSVKLTEQEKQRAARKYTVSIEAYDEFLQGQIEYSRRTREDNLWARESFQQSINLDPNFARAYSAMALTYAAEFRFSWHTNLMGSLAYAERFARKAVVIDDQLPHAYWVLSLHQHKYKQAIDFARKAIELNPNYADSYATLGVSYIYDGNPQAGVKMMRQAMRLSPQYPAAYASAIGQGYFVMGKYEDALPLLRDATERNVNLLTSQVFLVATLSQLGNEEEAAWVADQLRTLKPDFSVEQLNEMFPIKYPHQLQTLKESLQRFGF